MANGITPLVPKDNRSNNCCPVPEHASVLESAGLIDLLTLVVPWPLLYETLRTRFVRRVDWVAALDQRLKKPNVQFVDDSDYRD